MNITYQEIRPEDYEAVRAFLIEVVSDRRSADTVRFEKIMRNANRTVVAWLDDRVVGFGRALCDDVSNGYLSLLAVAPGMRGKGIGREIVRRLTGDGTGITWVLRAGHDSRAFWERMGFSPSQIAMEKTRTS